MFKTHQSHAFAGSAAGTYTWCGEGIATQSIVDLKSDGLNPEERKNLFVWFLSVGTDRFSLRVRANGQAVREWNSKAYLGTGFIDGEG